MTVKGTLLNNIAVKKIIKKCIYFHYIGMANEKLNFKLSYQLFEHFILLYLSLRHDFYCAHHATYFLEGKDNPSKGPLSKILYYFKVINWKFAFRKQIKALSVFFILHDKGRSF